ncbi:MAG: hypothetical protein MUF69_05700 [Desulfobacterota bacterium]|jgi:hypothetical protein|nr:hypothetical protein [Thermodesulfobacteriota bacterium]
MSCPNRFWWSLIALALFLGACFKGEEVSGVYQPVPGSPPEYADVTVELKKGGEGVRRVRGGEDQVFSWVVKGKKIRIHTQAGGVIVARPWGDLVEVKFPGRQVVYFKKIR